MSARWRKCRCGKKMKVTNTWDDKSRLACPSCGIVRHVRHVKICEVHKLSPIRSSIN